MAPVRLFVFNELMMKKITFFLLFFLAFAKWATAQTGCPDCIVTLSDTLPEDTIFLTAAPDGQVGQYYEADISFRMPKTTTPVAEVDPDVPAGLEISSITINSLSNIPPGLNWEISQTEFELETETDGCVRICGIPLQPGPYEVEVVLTATIFFIEETTSFSFPIFIAPAVSNTDGFTITNNSGCGEVTASFTNNVPSDSLDGFTYFWDFGNGNFTMEENPEDQTYSTPGTYEVDYRAIVDTSGYFLTRVDILETDCGDIFNNAPDLKVDILDPNGALIYVSNIQQDQTAPTSFNMNVRIDTGMYQIRVTDDDGGIDGSDDICGTIGFTQTDGGIELSDGSFALSLDIFHPIDTIQARDTITVFPQPSPPIINNFPFQNLCDGEEWLLTTNYTENVQWFIDSIPITDGTNDSLIINQTGEYYLIYTSPDGCVATSESVDITFNLLPNPPVFVNENNLLSVFNPDNLPENYSLQWYFGEIVLAGETELNYCIPASGTFTLIVTDLDTGCERSFSSEETFDPDFPNCVSDIERIAGLETWKVFPLPVKEILQTQIIANYNKDIQWQLINMIGQQQATGLWQLQSGENRFEVPVSHLPKGIYFLQITDGVQQTSQKVIKQ